MEYWTRVKFDVTSFEVFCSLAWALIPYEKRKVMEKKSQPFIFIGYYEDVKAYRIFGPTSKEFLFQRDVYFGEHNNMSLSCSLSLTFIFDN